MGSMGMWLELRLGCAQRVMRCGAASVSEHEQERCRAVQ